MTEYHFPKHCSHGIKRNIIIFGASLAAVFFKGDNICGIKYIKIYTNMCFRIIMWSDKLVIFNAKHVPQKIASAKIHASILST